MTAALRVAGSISQLEQTFVWPTDSCSESGTIQEKFVNKVHKGVKKKIIESCF